MFRALVPTFVLAGCGFSITGGAIAGDDEPPIIDAPRPIDAPDIDAPGAPPYLRSIDVTDAMVEGGPHTEFPLLVSITNAPWLRSQGNGGDVATMNGIDLQFFADSAATSQIEHEVEGYNPMTGTLTAWVRVPSLSASTVIYLRYGDPAVTTAPATPAVWLGYAGVWHLSSNLDDATAESQPGTNAGTTPTTGQISTGRAFDGVDDLINLGSASAIDNVFDAGGTVEVWFRAQSAGEGGYGRILDKGHDNGWSLGVSSNDGRPRSVFFVQGTSTSFLHWNTPSNVVTLGAWHHLALTYDRGMTPLLYLDGAPQTLDMLQSSMGTLDSDGANTLYAGNRATLDRTFDGSLDELRVSTGIRSASWIRTAYRNQSQSNAFYTLGNAVSVQ